jgi:hypothetical protein
MYDGREPDMRETSRMVLPGEAGRAFVADRVWRAKRSFACRRLDLGRVSSLVSRHAPKPGDAVLATVLDVGHHARLESPEGRRGQLYPGDEIVVAYGVRYAPDQFEAIVPDDLRQCDLVAGGGIAARVVSRHASTRKPTSIMPIGLLSDDSGNVLNLRKFALEAPLSRPIARQVVAVVGTSMNAGKTTAAAHLIRGLSAGGLRVAACKVTGTGSGGDLWAMRDAGAVQALDFTDVGFATTAGADIAAVEQGAHTLVSTLETMCVDIVVVEIADGLLQRETAALLTRGSSFASRLDAIFLAAADSMGAVAAAGWLRTHGLPLKAITGLVTASPLASREIETALDVALVNTKELLDPTIAASLCLQVEARQPRGIAS